jgi:hypothetical protein
MYKVMVIGLMVVAPIGATLIELAITGEWDAALATVGKWFLFWGVGVRLLVVAISQTFKPSFTAQNILGEKAGSGAAQIVQELGYANFGFGTIGLIAPWIAVWAVPAAIAPAIFLGLAGVRHILKPNKNGKEWIATLTDLFVAVVLAVFVIGSLVGGTPA